MPVPDTELVLDHVPSEEPLVVSQSAVIITSHPHLNWSHLVKGILESTHLPPSSNTELLNYSVLYNTPWKLENKYYAAVVQLSVLTNQWPQQLHSIKDQAEALIIYWDNTQEECLAKLNTIIDQLDDFKPEVCLLVCDGFSRQPKASRYESNQWCVAHGFELVELVPPEEGCSDEDELEDDFKESCGFHRIRGALHANCWTTMTHHSTAGAEGTSARSAPNPNKLLLDSRCFLPTATDPFVGAPALPSCLLNSDDEDDYDSNPQQELDDSFDDLFAKFENFRVTASSMQREDRLDYAERVAMAFLESMGGEDGPDKATANKKGEDHSAEHPYPDPSSSVSDSEADKKVSEKIGTGTTRKEEETCDVQFERLVNEDEFAYIPNTSFPLEELGFPILEESRVSDSTASTSTSDAVDSSGSGNDAAAMDEKSALDVGKDAASDDFSGPSYDEIEQEIMAEFNKLEAAKLKEREEILKELEEFPDPNKRVHL